MRFTLIKDLHKERSMVVMLTSLLLSILLYLCVDILVKSTSFGISLATLNTTLFGNAQEFAEPITRASFLEYIHSEIFFMMMLLLTLSAIVIRICKASAFALLSLNINLISALLSLLCLTLAYFYSASFLILYLSGFFLWHMISMYLCVYALWSLHAKTI